MREIAGEWGDVNKPTLQTQGKPKIEECRAA
jgi:hypothetical protein